MAEMKNAIDEVLTTMVSRFDHELFALTETELSQKWYFEWDDKHNILWNTYHFSDMLEMYKRRCRKWEEHHNGSCCVVDRVRDKYLMPRIAEFIVVLAVRMGGLNFNQFPEE